MLIKNAPPLGPELPLNIFRNDQLTSTASINGDDELDILFGNLSVFGKNVADIGRKNDFSAEKLNDDPYDEYDESLLKAKGPIKKTHTRDQPYEIPVPVQTYKCHESSGNGTATADAQRRVDIPNILMGSSNQCFPPLQSAHSSKSLRVDSPLSSDSGINSPSSSPNSTRHMGTWELAHDRGGFLSNNLTPLQPVGSPCSPESGYSPSSSPERSNLWLHPNKSYVDLKGPCADTVPPLDNTTPDSTWIPQFCGFPESNVTLSADNPDWQYQYTVAQDLQNGIKNNGAFHELSQSSRQESFLTTHFHGQNYGSYQSSPSLGDCENDDLQNELLDVLDKILGDNFDPAVLHAVHPPAPPLNQQEGSSGAPQPIPVAEPETEPKPKPKSQPKAKPKSERGPQAAKRKSNKSGGGLVSSDGAKPKLFSMIDLKKEATRATWMGISLMPVEEFIKTNSKGQNCLMEVLLEKKLSLERAYFIGQRMKTNPVLNDLLTAKDQDGANALYLSAMMHPQIPEVAAFIAENYAIIGADANEGFFDSGNSLIHCLVEKGESHMEVLRELLDLKFKDRKIFDPNVTNGNGDTPLHLAVRKLSEQSYPHNLSLVDVLIKRGASISIQNSSSQTPLHIAAAVANVACNGKVFRKLFERLSLPPEDNQDAMNIQDIDGNTPLHLVSYHINPCSNVENMKKVFHVFLSERNTRTDIINHMGMTAEGNIRSDCIKDYYDLFHKRK